MQTLTTGARIEIDAGQKTCVVRAGAAGPTLAAALVVRRAGQAAQILVKPGESAWEMDVPTDADAQATVVLYMTDDTQRGRVEDRGPITCSIGSAGFTLAGRPDKHGAIILAEIYMRNGRRMMRVRGDGYSFGIKALARKEDLPLEPFLPPVRRQRREERPGMPWDAPDRSSRPGQPLGSGSGVIVGLDHVITNAHVVRGGTGHVVHGPDGDVQGRVMGIDDGHDLALIRAPGIGGTALPIRPVGTLYLGEAIIAAGYPLRDVLGDDLKMTHGNVSGMKGQNGTVSVLQFSAPIGSGSSGGAVMDQAGNLVGIVTSALAHEAIRERGAISENMNFAVKASMVAEMMTAHEMEVNTTMFDAATPMEVAKRIRRSVVAITVTA